VLLAAALLRVYLGIDHFTDALFGVIIGISIPVAIFRAWAPNDVYPVQYGRHAKAAHLDVTGRRGEAIKLAMKEQLGYDVLSMKPVGLEGSGTVCTLQLDPPLVVCKMVPPSPTAQPLLASAKSML